MFLAEAILLSLAGGVIGVIIGAAATAIYARAHREAVVIPPAPGPAVWPPPFSSAPPGCCPLSAPRACHRLRRSGASDSTGTANSVIRRVLANRW